MNLSMRWLSDYVKIDVPNREFQQKMTMSGSIVEGFEIEGQEIKNVVVGKVLSVDRHPDADKLFVCQLDVGSGSPLQIVTGAPNLYPGAVVPVALDGAVLPGGKEIHAGKLRGLESNGMMCSINELGLTSNDFPGNDETGIMILDSSLPLGQDIVTALRINDTTAEFEITSNRPDCLSVIGLAREVAVTFDKPLTLPEPTVKKESGNISDYLTVEVRDSDLCPRYAAKVVKNVKIAPSPLWIRERLRASGVRPINNIVDITNYVMLEYGHPMHAFDHRYVNGGKIIVRKAETGESITTLDGAVRPLTTDMLVICDEKGPVAVAGVMGGEYSGIMNDTATVVFEAACFSGVSIRRTSKKLGLRTESSSRFEKGLDPNNALPALLRACQLVEELGAGEVVGGLIDVHKGLPAPLKVTVDYSWINAFLGTDIPVARMQEILTKLHFEVNGNEITVPTWRGDVSHKTDIAEEVARFYGYDKIPSTLIRGSSSGKRSHRQLFEKKTSETLLALGFNEVVTNSFASPKFHDKILLPADSPRRKAVEILNSLGEDTSLMRTSAMPGMLDVVARNIAARTLDARFFEIATEYLPGKEGELPDEQKRITLAIYGPDADYFALKGAVEDLVRALNIPACDYLPLSTDPSYHPGRTAQVKFGDQVIGILGEIHPAVAENFGIGQRVYFANLSFAVLYDSVLPEKTYAPLPKFPATTRDLALICGEEVYASSVEKIIAGAAGEVLEGISLFDVYTGNQVEKGKKSLAYSLRFRSRERTLTDDEADGIIRGILDSLNEKGIVLRG